MKSLNNFILEILKLTKDTKFQQYNFFPKDFKELRKLLERLLNERGKDADLNDIDVSQVTSFFDTTMYIGLFEYLDPHNIDISQWDVSNVETMYSTFYGCENFNCNLSKWKVDKVKNMHDMFFGCANFNCDLSEWDVSNVKQMDKMFNGCNSLKNKSNWYKDKE